MVGVARRAGSSWNQGDRRTPTDKGPGRWDYEQLLRLQADLLKLPDRVGRVRMALERLATLVDASCVVLTHRWVDAGGRACADLHALCRRPDADAFEYLHADGGADGGIGGRFGWPAGPYFDETIRPFGVDLVLNGRSRTQDDTGDIGCAVYREAGDTQAGRREREIQRLFGRTVAALAFAPEAVAVAPASPPIELPHLPPRFRPVLDGLLAGDAPKQIARKHGLSLHTTYEYTKQLYRRLNVNGRGELLALFVRR